MYKPTGSCVAIPTPFNESGFIDWKGFEILIDHHVAHGTSSLLVMGSIGEVTLLSEIERREIVRRVSKYAKGKLPVFFGSTFPTTEETIKFSQYAETEGADGLVFNAPPYLLLPQESLAEYLITCTKSVSIPVMIYNNPSRLGVFIKPEILERLVEECPNFVADKDAVPSVQQLVEVQRRVGERVNILCCDFPGYATILPTLAIGGQGTVNISGNIIPEEMAIIARPWDNIEKIEESRKLYFQYYPLMQALYWFSNPIVTKAALKILGLPAGKPRLPYPKLEGERLEDLKRMMNEMGIIEKYGQR